VREQDNTGVSLSVLGLGVVCCAGGCLINQSHVISKRFQSCRPPSAWKPTLFLVGIHDDVGFWKVLKEKKRARGQAQPFS